MENNGIYYLGQTLTIPPVGTLLKTATPLPANLGRGARIDYQVLPGDTLAGIAVKFNSLEEDIITLNNIENANEINPGDVLKIPVNLVTATATLPSTSTPVTPTVEGQPTQAPATVAAVTVTSGDASAPTVCAPTENSTFVTELLTLINNARTGQGLPALTVNQKLATAAKDHANDMVCNNYLSHIGLNNSTPEFRVAAQGYTGSFVLENLYALHPAYGGNPQSAFSWWTSDATSNANIFNPDVTEIGISYMVSEKSLFGGYFVVIFAKP